MLITIPWYTVISTTALSHMIIWYTFTISTTLIYTLSSFTCKSSESRITVTPTISTIANSFIRAFDYIMGVICTINISSPSNTSTVRKWEVVLWVTGVSHNLVTYLGQVLSLQSNPVNWGSPSIELKQTHLSFNVQNPCIEQSFSHFECTYTAHNIKFKINDSTNAFMLNWSTRILCNLNEMNSAH